MSAYDELRQLLDTVEPEADLAEAETWMKGDDH